jgi:hypothetical protein
MPVLVLRRSGMGRDYTDTSYARESVGVVDEGPPKVSIEQGEHSGRIYYVG